MAVFTTKDARVLMANLVEQATGQTYAVVDTSSFISAGEKVLETGMESTFNALNTVLGKLIVASRPYKAKLHLMDAENTGVFTNRLRKVSFYSNEPLNSGAFNTDAFTNLFEGFTNGANPDGDGTESSTHSMWEQHRQKPVELNFGNSATWQSCITMYEVQIQEAFRSEEEFAQFVSGYLTEHANDIESQREGWNRAVLLNKLASNYYYANNGFGSMAVDLTAGFNAKFGTSYTRDELLAEGLSEFLKYFVATIKLYSNRLTERTSKYHIQTGNTVNGEYILRHTPKDKQRLYLYDEFMLDAKTSVMPEIFNPEFLKIENYEPVSYWQTATDGNRATINVTPAVMDLTTGKQKRGSAVTLPYVLGLITDSDGLMTNMQLDYVATSPLEARKLYRNTWNTFKMGAINDPTENSVLFYMGDGGADAS